MHLEATAHIHRAIEQIKNKGKKAGVVINPGTPVSQILPIINAVDYVLIMTVNPGFGGQSFIEDCVDKVLELNTLKMKSNLLLILKLMVELMQKQPKFALKMALRC